MLRLFGANTGGYWRVDRGGVAGMRNLEDIIVPPQIVMYKGQVHDLTNGTRWDIDFGTRPFILNPTRRQKLVIKLGLAIQRVKDAAAVLTGKAWADYD